MKENLILGLKLFTITAIAGLLLGFAHEITKEPIERQEKIASSAIEEVLPMAKTAEEADIEIPEGSNITAVNVGYDGDNIVGYTIRITAKGYKGAIDMVVGISTEDKIEGIKIISHGETPGLGANIETDGFKGQFKGKSAAGSLKVVKTGASADNELDAISGATISSNAVTNAVNEAAEFYMTVIKG